jgi:hypothetical protein
MKNEHGELTEAGWSYRMNEHGWVIYRHPQTGRWHTRPEAMAIIEAEVISRVHNFPAVVLAAGQALRP